MVEEFDRTRQFSDQKGPAAALLERKLGEDSGLPGPNLLLEQMLVVHSAEDRRGRTGDPTPSDWWMGPTTPQQSSPSVVTPQPAPMSLQEVGFDIEHGPPGLPFMLAQARSASMEMPPMYDVENPIMDLSNKARWMMPELDNSMLPATFQMVPPASDLPIVRMDGVVPDPSMFQQAQSADPQQHYMPPQHDMFVEGYPASQFPNGHPETGVFIHHGGLP